MLTVRAEERGQYEMICLEDMAAKDHILRKIDEAIDFTHIYDIVNDKYCTDNGRPRMDVTVNPGNVHDSVAFDGLYDRLIKRFEEIQACVMDAGYKTP